MGEDLFQNLPSEMIINILSRLDCRTTIRAKCVCKPWLDLLTTHEFVKSHLSKSLTGLVIVERKSVSMMTYKMVDELDLNLYLNLYCGLSISVFNLDLPFCIEIHTSINGLILLREWRCGYSILCNPVTRDFIKLPYPGNPLCSLKLELYGFGVSRMSEKYKVVRISPEKHNHSPELKYSNSDECECQVYTVGTGAWRRIGKCGEIRDLSDNSLMPMTFLCGNLHWWWKSTQISSLDLETELFSTFSGPPCVKGGYMSSLMGCLCVCHNSYMQINMWVMKKYGDEKSWTKEFSMLRDCTIWDCLRHLDPIKVFRNGDMLMSHRKGRPLYYSRNDKTIRYLDVDLFKSNGNGIRPYTPSFLSLKTFATENVTSF
ncbi:F-box protein-like protein [Salvia divinorum]|uniref:F-box protein-like protein n=1 Tax=Salvia divinorum TaxID=28513 RepID=A0ABD1FSS1_SALDI